MHIPDGYLGPPTWAGSWALCMALWTVAGRKVRSALELRRLPLVAISAAFSFVIMMFNIPVPGGTTGHAVGGVLIAIAVGPWAAFLAISVALVLQALLFGDGGITAIGANCLNIAFAMPFAGYVFYQFLLKASGASSSRMKAWFAGIAGWLGLNVAAFLTALEFGIQPVLHKGAQGQALYAPFPLSVTVPVMMLEHVLLFGVVEGLVTGLVVYALSRSDSAWIVDSYGERP